MKYFDNLKDRLLGTFFFAVIATLMLMLAMLSCSEFGQPAFTDDEIMEHAKQKASSIVRDYYNNFSFFSFSTSVSNAFFEPKTVLYVEIKASYEWHKKEWNPTAGSYIPRIGWTGGFVDRQFKGDKTHALKFDVIRDVDSIEKTISYKSVSPRFEPPVAFSQ